VIEADESDRSLLAFHPDRAVITNISKDHFELEETRALFDAFRRQVTSGIVSFPDEPGLLARFDPDLSAEGSRFAYGGVEFPVPLPGRHNAENALSAIVLCERLGHDLEPVRDALRSFKGIHRRLERVGGAGGVTVYDEYAHNPAKIRAAWQAVAPYHRRVTAAWRPHGFGPLRMMMDELVDTFSALCRDDDRVFILPVYDAGGTADRRTGSGALVEALRERGTAAAAVEPDGLAGAVCEGSGPGDVVLVMGARDPGLPALAREVLARLRA
jgi:UDP-N-acetylmuramate--alanine ligase